jgi:hypothetical protein
LSKGNISGKNIYEMFSVRVIDHVNNEDLKARRANMTRMNRVRTPKHSYHRHRPNSILAKHGETIQIAQHKTEETNNANRTFKIVLYGVLNTIILIPVMIRYIFIYFFL